MTQGGNTIQTYHNFVFASRQNTIIRKKEKFSFPLEFIIIGLKKFFEMEIILHEKLLNERQDDFKSCFLSSIGRSQSKDGISHSSKQFC